MKPTLDLDMAYFSLGIAEIRESTQLWAFDVLNRLELASCGFPKESALEYGVAFLKAELESAPSARAALVLATLSTLIRTK